MGHESQSALVTAGVMEKQKQQERNETQSKEKTRQREEIAKQTNKQGRLGRTFAPRLVSRRMLEEDKSLCWVGGWREWR